MSRRPYRVTCHEGNTERHAMRFTLKQVEEITGLSDKTLRRRIGNGKLKSKKENGIIYIEEEDLPVERLATSTYTKAVAHVEQPEELPTLNPQIKELLDNINGMFTTFSEHHTKITEDYKQTVSPIVQAVTKHTPDALIEEYTALSQTVLNNLISMCQGGMLKLPPEVALNNLDKLAAMLFTDTGIPPEIVKSITEHAASAYRETHKEPSTV